MCVCVCVFADLTELFQNHKFVGCVDQTRALIQHQVLHNYCIYYQLLYCVCVLLIDEAVLGRSVKNHVRNSVLCVYVN